MSLNEASLVNSENGSCSPSGDKGQVDGSVPYIQSSQVWPRALLIRTETQCLWPLERGQAPSSPCPTASTMRSPPPYVAVSPELWRLGQVPQLPSTWASVYHYGKELTG